MHLRRSMPLFVAAGVALAAAASCSGSIVVAGDGGSGGSSGTSSGSGSGAGPGSDGSGGCGAAGTECCSGSICSSGLVCDALSFCNPPGSGSSGSSSSGAGGTSGSSSGLLESAAPPPLCRGGAYAGTFEGSYTSSLTAIGVAVPVRGTVSFTLEQVGTAMQTCTAQGESVGCNDLFVIHEGTVKAVAGTLSPMTCTMSGYLDCRRKQLLSGWLQCTTCQGALDEAGTGCAQGSGVGFAGPMTATYAYGTWSFGGSWNGAEALAGNDGGAPGPDGGPIAQYLSDSGTYAGPGNYGGSGSWSATWKSP